jgi:hypothetical protein
MLPLQLSVLLAADALGDQGLLLEAFEALQQSRDIPKASYDAFGRKPAIFVLPCRSPLPVLLGGPCLIPPSGQSAGATSGHHKSE